VFSYISPNNLLNLLLFNCLNVFVRIYSDKRGMFTKILERQNDAKRIPRTSPFVFFYGDRKFNIPPMKNSKYASKDSCMRKLKNNPFFTM